VARVSELRGVITPKGKFMRFSYTLFLLQQGYSMPEKEAITLDDLHT
jgi:hypothetical protein